MLSVYKRWYKGFTAQVALDVGIAVGGVLFTRLLNSAALILLARIMGVEEFGRYLTLYALLGPFVVISNLGLDTWLLRHATDKATAWESINQVFSIRLICTVLLLGIGVLVVLFGSTVPFTPLLAVGAALSLLAEVLLGTGYTALRAQLRSQMATAIQVVVAVLLVVLIWGFWNSSAPLYTAILYRLLIGCLGVGLLVVVLGSHLRLRWDPRRLWTSIREVRIYFFSDVLSAIGLYADLALTALLVGAIAAATYNPALTIINTTFFAPQVAWQVLLPIIVRNRASAEVVRRIIRVSVLASAIYGLLLAGVLLATSREVINLVYGASYRESAVFLQIMSVIPLLKSMSFCWVTFMIAYDGQVLRTKLQAVGVLFGLVGNLICIPIFGVLGAAWINVVSELVLAVVYSWGAWRTMTLFARRH